MKVVRLATLVAIALSLSAGSALAANGKGAINRRQERQQDRISQGIRSGALTPREAARLETQEARIAALEARARHSGGGLSPRERAMLERDLNRESRQIYRQKDAAQHR